MKTIIPTRCALLFCGLLAASLTVPVAVSAEDVTTVMKGASKRIPVPDGVRKVMVANPAIADPKVDDDGKSVLLTGLSEGSTELRIERLKGTDLVTKITVRADLQGTVDQVKELLGDVEGLEVKQVGEKVVFKGNLVLKSDYDKVGKVADAYSILNMTSITPSADINKLIADTILKDIGLDTITARVLADTVILEGVVYSESDVDRATEMAKLRMPNVKNLIRVQEVMIETDVQFVQVNSDASTDFGNNILKSVTATGTGTGAGSTRGGSALAWASSVSASAKINALVGAGQGKIMINKNVSSKSGTEGRAMVGGEFGISVSGQVGGSLEKVQFGIILKVKPTLQGRDSIVSEVTVEVSMPVGKAQSGGYSLEKSETKTTVLCKVGESIVLSGLVQSLAISSKEKTPLIGDIPLLSLFFSEKTSRKDKKEVVLLMTPRVIIADAAKGGPFSDERKRLMDDKVLNPKNP